MLTDEVLEKVVERLTLRIQEANTSILAQIGESIKKIGKLSPSKAQELIQILRYGGDFDKIVKQLATATELNVKDIYKIFEEVAKNDYNFAKQFYDYKGKKFIPYKDNFALQNQVNALARLTAGEYTNLMNTRSIGFSIEDINGNKVFKTLDQAYTDILDRAVLNVGQGKETFDSAMRDIIKQFGESGLKRIEYESGRSIRLDSALRMQLKGALRNLHNETQKTFGEEFESDGVEISVHLNPAPDHAEVQGHQFSNEEFDKFQNDQDAVDYKGKLFPAEFEGHDRRSISQYNCYHYIFSIVLGVSKPQYDDEQLQKIIDDNNRGFELDGKHYTNYEGTQMQRQLESKIRQQKDIQIMARKSGNEEFARETQGKIDELTQKYYELSKESGLPTKLDRLRISQYRPIKATNLKEIEYAREHNYIWHSTESLEDIIKENKLKAPSLAIGNKIETNVKYGTQFIEFKPELLENVNKNTILYNGDGGNKFSKNDKKFNNLMQMLKNDPKTYNELKFNNDLESLKYIKKVYIRQDESQKIIELLKKNNINYEIYYDNRIRRLKKK